MSPCRGDAFTSSLVAHSVGTRGVEPRSLAYQAKRRKTVGMPVRKIMVRAAGIEPAFNAHKAV